MKDQIRSKRLESLPEYLFAELDRKKGEMRTKGVDVIDLGIGDPDLPPPAAMIEALKNALDEAPFHRYPSYNGAEFFRAAVSKWLSKHHNVSVDHDQEVLTLIGSKEGLAHLPLALLNPGDKAVVTDPCYPVHLQSIQLAGGIPVKIPLKKENSFLPDLSSVDEKVWRETRLIFLNFPSNPTSATATRTFFTDLVALAQKYNFAICQDAAYIDICLDGEKQPALLSIPGAKDVAVEFFSLSKTFNVCGWRLGFCAGNAAIIRSLLKFKTTVDSGQFTALQKAGAVALSECMGHLEKTLKVYRERKNILCAALEKIGLNYFRSNATFYIWSEIPEGYDSRGFANLLLEKAGIVATPGIGFGSEGDAYVRFSLTTPTDRLQEAARRLVVPDTCG